MSAPLPAAAAAQYPMGSQKLLLIDGLNFVRRIYEGNPAEDSAEKANAAVGYCVSNCRRALLEHTPTHALACFDFGGDTWRHQLYSEYKANRSPMPEPLRAVLPLIIKEFAAMGVASVSIPGVEADDSLAVAALRWSPERGKVVILSTDKDLCQLLADHIVLRDHFKPEFRDESWVHAKFGIPSRLLGDLLALTGDATDNIPGVQKIGLKTASKLLTEYGSLQGVLAQACSVEGIAGVVGQNLRSEADVALLSRQLVTLRTEDLPLGLTWRQLEIPAAIRATLIAAGEAVPFPGELPPVGADPASLSTTPPPGLSAPVMVQVAKPFADLVADALGTLDALTLRVPSPESAAPAANDEFDARALKTLESLDFVAAIGQPSRLEPEALEPVLAAPTPAPRKRFGRT